MDHVVEFPSYGDAGAQADRLHLVHEGHISPWSILGALDQKLVPALQPLISRTKSAERTMLITIEPRPPNRFEKKGTLSVAFELCYNGVQRQSITLGCLPRHAHRAFGDIDARDLPALLSQVQSVTTLPHADIQCASGTSSASDVDKELIRLGIETSIVRIRKESIPELDLECLAIRFDQPNATVDLG